jgi:hypothetical protein
MLRATSTGRSSRSTAAALAPPPGEFAESGVHDVRGGLATSSTAGGFLGRYTITYEGAGSTTFGPFDWTIAPRAGVFDLTWDMAGNRVIDGFGLPDPHSSRSIIVVYWGARND